MDHVSVFERWGRTMHRRRRLVLVIASVGVVFAVVWGTGVFGQLQTAGGFNAPNSQSQKAGDLATTAFGRDAGDVVVLYSSPTLRRCVARLPGRRDANSDRAAPRRCAVGRDLLVHRFGRASSVPAVMRPMPCSSCRGATDTARQNSYDAIKTESGRTRPRHQRRWAGPDRRDDQQPDHQGHKAGREPVLPDPAGSAPPDLRQPDGGRAAAGHRRRRASSGRSPRCGS